VSPRKGRRAERLRRSARRDGSAVVSACTGDGGLPIAAAKRNRTRHEHSKGSATAPARGARRRRAAQRPPAPASTHRAHRAACGPDRGAAALAPAPAPRRAGDRGVSTEAIQFIEQLPKGKGPSEVPRASGKTLLAIASFMSHAPGKPGHGVCFASQSTIARRASLCERTVRGHIADLEDSGIIYRGKREYRSRGRSGATSCLCIRGYSDLPAGASAWSRGAPGPTGNGILTNRQRHPDQPEAAADKYNKGMPWNAGDQPETTSAWSDRPSRAQGCITLTPQDGNAWQEWIEWVGRNRPDEADAAAKAAAILVTKRWPTSEGAKLINIMAVYPTTTAPSTSLQASAIVKTG